MKIKSKKTKQMPMTRNEFKTAITQMSHAELVSVLCDIYYANADGSCGCDCGCDSKKIPAKAKKCAPASKASKR
jgi:hypothetical protein